MSAPPARAAIARHLRTLARRMDAVAVEMDYYGGFAPWGQHAKELAGAAAIAREWAEEIDREGIASR